MKIARLLHNPNAGDKEHDGNYLVSLIESKGYRVNYASVKEPGWKKINIDTDFIVVAGGDGTVRKVAKKILERSLLDRMYPIALLPMGTANNIGRSLSLDSNMETVIESWHNFNIRKYDVGKIFNLPEKRFFLESFGFGVFPNLMREMKESGRNDIEDPQQQLKAAQELLLQLVETYTARKCTIVLDNVTHSGKFLMVEVMNTHSIGPNLQINPNGDNGDGEFELVLIPEEDREKLALHVKNMIEDKDVPCNFKTLKGKNLTIAWDGIHAHIDDELVKLEKNFEIDVFLHEKLLEFIVPLEKPAVIDAT